MQLSHPYIRLEHVSIIISQQHQMNVGHTLDGNVVDVHLQLQTLPGAGRQFERAGARAPRTRVYKLLNLFRSFAELSARVEALVFEARTLAACKASAVPRIVTELPEAEQRHLEDERVKRMQDLLQKTGLSMVKAIMQHKFAYVFNQPVDTNAYPNYLQTVQQPMDLGTIKERLEAGNHFKELKEVWTDVCLVFHNARLFNPPGSDVHIMAQTMQEYAEDKWEKGVAPKLIEENLAAAREEAAAKRRHAEMLTRADTAAMEHQALQLVGVIEELNSCISDAKTQAAALCEGLTQIELDQLGVAIKGLPAKQLQAAVQLVVARAPAQLQPTQLQQGVPELPGVNARKVVLELESYEPITLRLLQLLVTQAAAAPPPPTPPQPDAGQDKAGGESQTQGAAGQADGGGGGGDAGDGAVAQGEANKGTAPPAVAPATATVPAVAGGGGGGIVVASPSSADPAPSAAAGPPVPPPPSTTAAEPNSSGHDKAGSAGNFSSPFASAWSQEGAAALARGASVQGPMAGVASGVGEVGGVPGVLDFGSFPDVVGDLRSIPDFLMAAGGVQAGGGGMAGVCSQAGVGWPLVAIGAGRRAAGHVSVRTGEEQLAHQRRERQRHQQVLAAHHQQRQRKVHGQLSQSRMRHQASLQLPPADSPYATPLPPSHHMSSTVHLPSFPAPPILPPPPSSTPAATPLPGASPSSGLAASKTAGVKRKAGTLSGLQLDYTASHDSPGEAGAGAMRGGAGNMQDASNQGGPDTQQPTGSDLAPRLSKRPSNASHGRPGDGPGEVVMQVAGRAASGPTADEVVVMGAGSAMTSALTPQPSKLLPTVSQVLNLSSKPLTSSSSVPIPAPLPQSSTAAPGTTSTALTSGAPPAGGPHMISLPAGSSPAPGGGGGGGEVTAAASGLATSLTPAGATTLTTPAAATQQQTLKVVAAPTTSGTPSLPTSTSVPAPAAPAAATPAAAPPAPTPGGAATAGVTAGPSPAPSASATSGAAQASAAALTSVNSQAAQQSTNPSLLALPALKAATTTTTTTTTTTAPAVPPLPTNPAVVQQQINQYSALISALFPTPAAPGGKAGSGGGSALTIPALNPLLPGGGGAAAATPLLSPNLLASGTQGTLDLSSLTGIPSNAQAQTNLINSLLAATTSPAPATGAPATTTTSSGSSGAGNTAALAALTSLQQLSGSATVPGQQPLTSQQISNAFAMLNSRPGGSQGGGAAGAQAANFIMPGGASTTGAGGAQETNAMVLLLQSLQKQGHPVPPNVWADILRRQQQPGFQEPALLVPVPNILPGTGTAGSGSAGGTGKEEKRDKRG